VHRRSGDAVSAPPIQWYPGHIAKAEQQLKRNLEKVDLVIEVRDARIPLATGHPHLNRWLKGKQHLLVINRRDMVTKEAWAAWEQWFKAKGQRTVWCDAKAGTGVKQVQQAAIRAGDQLNERRRNRGMRPRAVRALTLGFPNVGKSALINRLVKKKVVASARRAGVTRTLRWVRLGQDLDLLDAPGVLPPRLDDQQAALHLALCDDIGQAAYNGELVAQAFLQLLIDSSERKASGVVLSVLETRYGIPVAGQTLDPSIGSRLLRRDTPRTTPPAWRSGFWMTFVNPPWATSPWNCRSSSTVDVVEPGQGRPPLPEEVFTHTFGEGEGELVTLTYPKPLPMRLDRWLVSQRTEQSRARIQKFIDAGYVRVNGKQGKAKTPLRRVIRCSCGCRRRSHCLT
jgi:ribosome biogenesis GTPase A